MILGLLPSIRGGLGELAKTGQHTRLIDGYLKPYARAFDEVRYFSYLDESLERYTADPAVLASVRLYPAPGLHPWLWTLWMPLRHGRPLRACGVLRVFQVTGTLPAVIARRRDGVPFATSYGFSYARLAGSPFRGWLRRIVERVGLASADAVIVPTEELRAVVARRVSPERIHLVPNGVDTERFRPAPTREIGRVRTVLYVGRLSAEKNLETLVDAAAKLQGRFDLRLALIGQGPLREALEQRARRRGVAAEFVPVVDHQALPARFAAASVFVLPSHTEGHPKVLLEAMACGLPCVASNVGGSRSIVTDGESGLLFEPDDPDALAERLERVLGQDDLAARLGERARAVVTERYALGALVAREIELLRRIGR